MVLCGGRLRSMVSDLDARCFAYEDIPTTCFDSPELAADADVVFVQFSSGTTSEPRGCMLTAGAIAGQLRALTQSLCPDPEADTSVIWLPLSHDMGLFGCLLYAYWAGHSVVIGTPERFLTAPATWLQDCAHYQATMSATPAFALELVARLTRPHGLESFPMRAMVIGGDHVPARTLNTTVQQLGGLGFGFASLVPAYGLAEAVLAVTMRPLNADLQILTVDRSSLSNGQVLPKSDDADSEAGVDVVSVGVPVPGTRLYIQGSTDVGEIIVRSGSQSVGYLDDPVATAARFGPEGIHTGDLGFIHRGQLFVTGRMDDLMSIGGRNVYARDIEGSLTGTAGVRRGGIAVVDVDGRLVVLVERADQSVSRSAITREVRSRARAAAGVHIDRCILLERGALPKTPSGKLQRHRCRLIALDRS